MPGANYSFPVVLLLLWNVITGAGAFTRTICRDSPRDETVDCGTRLIDVTSHVMAGLEGEPGSDACAPARLDALFRDARCVDSTDATAAFLYRSCHGLRRCVLQRSVYHWPWLGDCWALTLRFRYTCIEASAPSAAFLPVTTPVRGTAIHLFSPHYPCEPPPGRYSVRCTLSPQRLTFTDVYYRITPKLFRCGTSVRVQRETSHDIVTCAASGSSTSGVEVWDGDPFTTRMLGEELVIVFTASTAGDAKFWFKAEAFYSLGSGEAPDELSLSCTNQDRIPQLSTRCAPYRATDVSEPSSNPPGGSGPGPGEEQPGEPGERPAGQAQERDSDGEGGVSTALIGGLVALGVVLVIGAAIVAFVVWRRQQANKSQTRSQHSEPPPSSSSTNPRPPPADRDTYATIPDYLVPVPRGPVYPGGPTHPSRTEPPRTGPAPDRPLPQRPNYPEDYRHPRIPQVGSRQGNIEVRYVQPNALGANSRSTQGSEYSNYGFSREAGSGDYEETPGRYQGLSRVRDRQRNRVYATLEEQKGEAVEEEEEEKQEGE